MAWWTVLKLVPWGEVIRNAPAVAEGAKKLWDTVGRRAPGGEAEEDAGSAGDAPAAGQVTDATPVAALAARLHKAETEVAQLNEEMRASSALIKALAEQNAELVQRVDLHRRRMFWVVGLVLVFGAIAALNLAVTFSS